MSKVWTLVIALVVGLGICACAQAAGDKKDKKGGDRPKPTAEERFKKLDKDGDGSVSKDEFTAKAKDQAKAEEQFLKMDTNGDKKLNLDEFKAAAAKHGKKKKEEKK